MRAIRLHAPGVDGLRQETIETPRLRAGEVLVEVHAAAITRDELEWPLDRLPAIPAIVTGADFVPWGSMRLALNCARPSANSIHVASADPPLINSRSTRPSVPASSIRIGFPNVRPASVENAASACG